MPGFACIEYSFEKLTIIKSTHGNLGMLVPAFPRPTMLPTSAIG